MTFTPHAVVGAAIASAMPTHPILGLTLAFVSHFILDAIPHWEYDLSSKSETVDPMNSDLIINKRFFQDLLVIGTDAIIGLLIVLLCFTFYGPHLLLIPILGALAAVLPDGLQFLYFKWRHQPLISLQRFHIWIHAPKDFKYKLAVGVFIQIIIMIAGVSISRLMM
jgi:hypothetical protein